MANGAVNFLKLSEDFRFIASISDSRGAFVHIPAVERAEPTGRAHAEEKVPCDVGTGRDGPRYRVRLT